LAGTRNALSTTRLSVMAPAKINLFLHVVGKRDDGYHELRTLMCCIGLYDSLVLHVGAERSQLTSNVPEIPSDDRNLALKAALLFNRVLAERTALRPRNVSIELIKRIPVGAGLGGGSSDAAAVMNALNGHYGHPLDRAELHALALSLGADVPFFIDQKPAIATGVGECLEPYSQLPAWRVVVVYPGFGISTAEVFAGLTLGLTKCEKQLRYFPFKYGKFDIGRHLCNDLESVAARRFPVINIIKKELLHQGAMGALMTGSGSAVFGVFADPEAARRAGVSLSDHADWKVFDTAMRV
jgi:4-diphosphocytidyl-2-C-methyl-D-erythritol kinase